jgi:hypothetical protein
LLGSEALGIAGQRVPIQAYVGVRRQNMGKPAANRAKRRRKALAPGIVPGGWCCRCPLCGRSGECFSSGVKSGRCGDWVWYVWKGYQWRRRWVKPYDPKTAKQRAWRAHLAAASQAYSEELTDEQRHACIAAGAKRKTRPRLGQSGPETGQQWWVGQESKQKPPAPTLRAGKPKT